MGHLSTRLAARDAVYVFADESNHGDIANVMTGFSVVDTTRGPNPITTRDDAVEWVLEHTKRCGALHRRLHRIPGDLDYPCWVDAEIDPDHHIRFRQVGPTSRTDLYRLLASIVDRPLDLTRPLWEVHVLTDIRGVADIPDGATIVALRVHHSVTDGMGMRQISRALYAHPDAQPAPRTTSTEAPGALAAALTLPVRYGRFGAAVVRALRSRRALGALARTGAITPPVPHRPTTRFNREDPGSTQIGRISLELRDVKALAHATGSSVNDVMLTVVAEGMRAYLADRDETPPASLAAQVPTALKDRSDLMSENKVTLMYVDLHTDEPDLITRLRLIRESAGREKDRVQRPESIAVEAPLDLCPSLELKRSLRRVYRPKKAASAEAGPLTNTVVSNVARGPAADLRFGDSPVVDGFGPSYLNRNCGLMHVVTSLENTLNLIFTSKTTAMPDPDEYERLLTAAFENLRSASGIGDLRPDVRP